jgi:hypothetical protein
MMPKIFYMLTTNKLATITRMKIPLEQSRIQNKRELNKLVLHSALSYSKKLHMWTIVQNGQIPKAILKQILTNRRIKVSSKAVKLDRTKPLLIYMRNFKNRMKNCWKLFSKKCTKSNNKIGMKKVKINSNKIKFSTSLFYN